MSARTLVIFGCFAAIATLVIVTITRESPLGPPVKIDLASSSEGPRLAASPPGTVRIAVEPKTPAQNGESEMQATKVLDVEHLGPLAAAEQATLMQQCSRLAVKRQTRFEARRTDAIDSGHLLEEAQMLFELRVAEAAGKALERGSYLVLKQDDSLPITLPGAEVLAAGSTRSGAQVNVCIVMAHDAYPELREARAYLDDMQFFDGTEKARKFNSLPDEERMAIATTIRELLRKDDRSAEDDAYLRNIIGGTTQLRGDLLFAYPPR